MTGISMARDAAQQAAFMAAALRAERMRPDRVRAAQDRALRAMVRHAATGSPFWRERLRAAGVAPEQVRGVADLGLLPITTKADLQAAGPDRLLPAGFTAHNTIREPTSGSSGLVLDTFHSRAAFNRYFAFAFRHLSAIGYRPWHRVAYTSFEPLRALPWEWIGLGTRQQVDVSLRDPRRYVEALLRIRPDVITAYPSILQLVMEEASAAELARIRPKVIHLHSELLTDGLRARIRAAFGCDCFDDYSTFEFHHVAYECPRHSYHVAADNVIVEFVRDGRAVAPGEPGEILLTGLTNKAMPLLRYAIGDVGVAGDRPCPCGRGFPTLRLIEGRVDDFVVLPSGRRFSPRMINPVYEELPGVLEHVLVQEALDHVVVHVNVAAAHRDSTPLLVEAALRELFAEPVRLDVRLTTEFERGRTGKLRNVVSKVVQR